MTIVFAPFSAIVAFMRYASLFVGSYVPLYVSLALIGRAIIVTL